MGAKDKGRQKRPAAAGGMTVEEYRQMKADDPYKPVVIKPAPTPKRGKK